MSTCSDNDRTARNYKINAGNTPYFYYTNTPAPRTRQMICGVNCNCSEKLKMVLEKWLPGYEFIKFLGNGGFGDVNLYRDRKTHETVVIKSISYEKNGQCIFGEVSSEYDIVIHIDHPNITKYHKFFINTSSKTYYLVMEYASRGSLRKFITGHIRKNRFINPCLVLKIIHEIISGVHFLNSQHVVHCDLKPENILIGDDNNMKICDFGTSHFVYDVNAKLTCTLTYMAPEQFNGMRPNEKTEVWAIGIILYELCALQHPFGTPKNVAQLQQKLLDGHFPSLQPIYGDEMQKLVRSMLSYNYQQRETLANILRNKLFKF